MGEVFSFGKSRAKLFKKDPKGKNGISFKDVAGVGEAKRELEAVGLPVEVLNVDTALGRDTAQHMGIKGGLPTFVRGEKIVQGWTGSVGSLLAKL